MNSQCLRISTLTLLAVGPGLAQEATNDAVAEATPATAQDDGTDWD